MLAVFVRIPEVISPPNSSTKPNILIPADGAGWLSPLRKLQLRPVRKSVKDSCQVTVSIGVSHYKELSGNINELIANADKALYEAKRKGKDKVLLYRKGN